ncbi:hypothetical protein R3P38DRAFT_2527345, partial [Favolaschia claudopus]
PHQQSPQSPPASTDRAPSSNKRAEQNRKAQRTFRARRHQRLKYLESRSPLLDAAVASSNEANRRWEESRLLLDDLRAENAALRAAVQQAQLLPRPHPSTGVSPITHSEEPENDNLAGDIKRPLSVATQHH